MCNSYLELASPQWFNRATVFAPHRCLTVLSATSLSLAAGCMGGQSGDDGDYVPEVPAGGMPEECGSPHEMRTVEADEETSLGLTPEQLVAGLEQPELPFHWVEYSSTNLTAAHAPGPGATTLNLAFTLRSNPEDLGPQEAVKELVNTGDAGTTPCGDLVVAPVWVELETEDGAVDARIKGQLAFYSARSAGLYARFSPAALGGTFQLDAPVSKDAAQTWTVSAFALSASVWDGGSKGILTPEFTAKSTVAMGGGEAVSPPPSTVPVTGDGTIAVPDSWEAVGVWPRLEQCVPGMAIDMDDAIIGQSPRDILGVLGAETEFSLAVRTNATSNGLDTLDVELTTTLPDGLVCVNPSPQTGTLDITVPAHLGSTAGDAGAALDTDLRLTVRGYVDSRDPDVALTKVHFERAVEDVVLPLDRENFESSTGVSLAGTSAEYSQVWWTWFGDFTATDGAMQGRATFLVTSPNTEQTAEAESQAAEGGPGFQFSIDESGQHLPGDKLVEATLEP